MNSHVAARRVVACLLGPSYPKLYSARFIADELEARGTLRAAGASSRQGETLCPDDKTHPGSSDPIPNASSGDSCFATKEAQRVFVTYATKEEAEQVKRALERQLKRDAIPTLAQALIEYASYMLDVKQNKPQSVKTTLFRLLTLFPDQEMILQDVTPRYAAATYMNTAKAQATDTHRNQLAEVKTFFRWCEGQEVAQGKSRRADRRGRQAQTRQAAAPYR